MTEKQKRKRRKKRLRRIKRIVLSVVIALVLLIILICVVNWMPKKAPAETQPVATRKLVIDPLAGALATPVPDPGVLIPGWTMITLPAGQMAAQVALNNPAENEGNYYLTFELLMKDTGEIIFESGLIPPGLYLNGVNLNRPLEAGTYEAVLHVQPYTMSDIRAVNDANIELQLIVK